MLTYSIAREWLEGKVGTKKFAMRTWSGGGRGRTEAGAERTWSSYDVKRKTTPKGPKHVHGGPLPPGLYVCRFVANHTKFGDCVYLEQTISSLVEVSHDGQIAFVDRDAFFIHKQGQHGSDGCLVPESESERLRLTYAIKSTGPTLLNVVEKGMPLPAEYLSKSTQLA
jgi:hypothetical protein